MVTEGPYGRIRHPQYSGFILIIFGFLVQWPTLITIVMAPILIVRYVLLAKKEESNMVGSFGDEYVRYAKNTPRFIPKLLRGSFSHEEPKDEATEKNKFYPIEGTKRS